MITPQKTVLVRNCHGSGPRCSWALILSLTIAAHMKIKSEEWLILGITPEGRSFRPSDWVERLCGALACYDRRGRWVYSEYAQPVIHEGQVGIRLKAVLHDIHPSAYQFIMDFARDNRLKMTSERKVIYLDERMIGTAPVPLVKKQNQRY